MGKKLRKAALGLTMAGIVAGGIGYKEHKNSKQAEEKAKTEQTNKALKEEHNKKINAMKVEKVSIPSPQQKEIDCFRSIFNDATSYDVTTNKHGHTVYIAEYIPTPEQKQSAAEKLKKLEKLKKTILEKENPRLHQAAKRETYSLFKLLWRKELILIP